jgi:hypothetical protein
MSFVIPTRTFEKPQSGQYHAVLADIVDLGKVTTVYNNQTKVQPMVRFVWILNVLGNDPVNFPDTYGKPLQVAQRFNVTSLHEKSNVYKTLKQILGQPPSPTLDIETLIGQTRILWISREKSPDGSKDFANIMGILPAQPGVVVPIPADFIRAKFRVQQTAGPQGQPVQTYAQPLQQPQQPAQSYGQPVQQVQYAPQPTQPPVQQYAPQAGPVPTPQGADVKF